MKNIFLLFIMIFMHIVADYNLQGILAQLKQKEWWKENYPDEKYKNDYRTALMTHAFQWSFLVVLPLWIYGLFFASFPDKMYEYVYTVYLVVITIFNTFIHYHVDDSKANLYQINLRTDQLMHLLQIIITWLIFLLFKI